MQNYKFGFNVFNYPPEDFLDYSHKNNLGHIEINTSQSHSSIESFDEKRIAKLNKKTNEFNIQLSLHLPNKINIGDNISHFRKSSVTYLCNAIDLASKINANYINCHLGFFFWFPVEKWRRNKSLNRFLENLKMISDKCNECNVVLALENVTPLPHGSDHLLLGDNINDFEFIFSNVDSPSIKFCLDTGHANVAEGVGKYLDNFSDKLHSVHYHDNLGNDDSHLVIDQGNIDWKQFSKKIKDAKFYGPFVSECKNQKPHESASLLTSYLSNS